MKHKSVVMFNRFKLIMQEKINRKPKPSALWDGLDPSPGDGDLTPITFIGDTNITLGYVYDNDQD